MTEADVPLWRPDRDRVEASVVTRFARHVGVEGGFRGVHRWSIAEPGAFWAAVWDFCGVVGERGDRAVEHGADFADERFLPDAELSFAENLLLRDDDGTALVFRSEDGRRRTLTWAALSTLVSRVQQALRRCGVGRGDVVAAWLAHTPESYALMLAANGLGAIYTSTSPDFGVSGVVDRFGQVRPKVLVASDGYPYAGRWHERSPLVDEVRAALPSVTHAPVVGYDGDWGGFLDGTDASPPTFERLPFDHPLYVLYSSGTTGAPKCIVHRAGGILLKHLVEHQLHLDVRPGDRVFHFTTTGWMMWNWLASALASEATLVVYDGSPGHPDPGVLFDLAEETETTLFGTSAKFIDSLRKADRWPGRDHDLGSVRTITSTGSPLVPEGFGYVYERVAPDVHLASISGGTDLCGCLVAGDPTAPVWAGEIQAPGLGMAIEVLGPDGEILGPGEQGELVCTAPFPSMPLGFWGDPGQERYRAAYFDRYRGVWHQGDFAERTAHDGFVIHGRSDATLNPGGVRIGTAEIYRQVEELDEIVEALVVGQRWDDDTRVVLFVVLREGTDLDDDLVARVRDRVRTGASPRHVPAVVLAVPELPRTRSGKITELAVRAVVHGEPVRNVEALANPGALAHFADRPELAP